jgi:hypothetical protein
MTKPHFSLPATLVLVIAPKMRALLHFLSTRFATIEVEVRIDVAASGRTRGTGSDSVSF